MRASWTTFLGLVLVAAGAGTRCARGAGAGVEYVPPVRAPRNLSVRALRAWPGLGERLARAVVEERERRGAVPFRWEDVPGLGPLRAATLRAHLEARGLPPEPFELGAARYPAVILKPRATVLALVAGLVGCGVPSPDGAPAHATPGPSAVAPGPREEVHRLAAAEVHVRALGAGPRGVLFLHGARYSSAEWVALGSLEHVAHRGLRALALDWPGSGASPSANPVPDAAALLVELLDALELEEVVLVAPSRGGAQAFALLARGEPRVVALLALAPAASEGFVPAPGSTKRLHVLWGDADEVLPVALGEALAGRLPWLRLEHVPAGSHAWYLQAPERFHAALDGLLDGLDWHAR